VAPERLRQAAVQAQVALDLRLADERPTRSSGPPGDEARALELLERLTERRPADVQQRRERSLARKAVTRPGSGLTDRARQRGRRVLDGAEGMPPTLQVWLDLLHQWSRRQPR
jgi:hypothetical protein